MKKILLLLLLVLAVSQVKAIEGEGLAKSPYRISTPEDLDSVRFKNSGSVFVLMNDIDMTEYIAQHYLDKGWKPIDSAGKPFTGIFNGQGYTISGLTINDSTLDNAGLFSINSGVIKYLGIKCSINARNNVGGICGNNRDSVSYSYVVGDIKGSGSVGGISGYNQKTIEDSYHIGEIQGKDSVGGIVGWNDGVLNNSYHSGNVTAESGNVGGVYNGTPASSCYYDSTLSTITGNIRNLSGAMSTKEMITQATFADWNFDSIWVVKDSITPAGDYNLFSYPYLRSSNNIFYAYQTPAKYKIILDFGYNNLLDTIDVYYNSPIGDSLITPSRITYDFLGWYEQPDGGGTQYTPETIYRHTDNIILYAYWIVPLQSLSISDGYELSPAFAPNITSYSVQFDSCPVSEQNLSITATARTGIDITYGGAAASDGTLQISADEAGDHIVEITATAEDGGTSTYTITIKQPLPETLLRRLWTDVIAVNLDSTTNGGYNFINFDWYKNGRTTARNGDFKYYSSNLEDGAEYHVILTTSDGRKLQTCPYTYQAPAMDNVKTYPNPARQGAEITVDLSDMLELPEYIEIFNSHGVLLKSSNTNQSVKVTVSMPYSEGLYVVKAGKYLQKILLVK